MGTEFHSSRLQQKHINSSERENKNVHLNGIAYTFFICTVKKKCAAKHWIAQAPHQWNVKNNGSLSAR